MTSDGVCEAETAARWWTMRLDPAGELNPTPQQRQAFRAALRADLLRRMHRWGWAWPHPAVPYDGDPPEVGRGLMSMRRRVRCDFDPGDRSLCAALRAAGLPAEYPVLTGGWSMWINPDLVIVHDERISFGPLDRRGLPSTCEVVPLVETVEG